uniref:Cilia and flagella associated protein 410 n=1 Tax=Cynoglossus semilaevis TaxID=244447 RepID=A0A3P8VEL4_CYNSE
MKLTRQQVLAKAKASDLESISIFSQIPNIKVLTLSANSISSLAPLAQCLSLCELYLWRNMIPSLSELSHLQPLTHLKVLWLAENPCCGTESNKYRMTVLRTLPHLHRLDNQAVVTNEEVNLAVTEGDVVTTPPGTNQTQLPTNGLSEAEAGNDPGNYNMEETNKIREELGMKPLSRDKFPSLSSPSTKESKSLRKVNTHTLDAVLLLLGDMDREELHVVLTATQNRLQAFTLQELRLVNN